MTGEDSRFDYEDYYRKTYRKAVRLLEAGCVFSDFGTRRRVSFEAEETVVRAMRDCYQSRGMEREVCRDQQYLPGDEV